MRELTRYSCMEARPTGSADSCLRSVRFCPPAWLVRLHDIHIFRRVGMIDFTGKVALITGASSGIGRSCALTLARYGAAVIVADITEKGGLETVRMARELGARAEFVAADVSKAFDVDRIEALARERFGGMDVAVNAAGIPGRMSSTIDMEEADMDSTYAINVRGLWLCMRAEMRRML